MKKWIFLLLISFSSVIQAVIPIKNLVIFGDSLSDNGYEDDGGFNRYSNGYIWSDYLGLELCRLCVENNAWGGAKTDYSNIHGFNWSGIQWQIKQYKLTTKPDETIYIIWAGANDLLDSKEDPTVSTHNLMIAAQSLAGSGAKYIFIANLPNITLAPAFNNSKLEEYKTMGPMKDKLKTLVDTHNKLLTQAIAEKQKYLEQSYPKVKIYLIDFTDFYENILKNKIYDNTIDTWLGTWKFPILTGYMWWDAFHPMTSVHKQFAAHIRSEIVRKDFELSE